MNGNVDEFPAAGLGLVPEPAADVVAAIDAGNIRVSDLML